MEMLLEMTGISKILLICLLLLLTSCVVRTTTTYVNIPVNGEEHKVDQKEEVIWIWEK
jgi:hypothetical protein